MRNIIVMFVIIILSLFNTNAQYRDAELDTLIEQWNKRDGTQFLEIGPAISRFLIRCDSIFFELMKDNPETFSSWLDKLENSSFTIFEAGNDAVEQELYSAYYMKLKEMMLTTTKKWIDNIEYGDLAKRLHSKLIEVKLIFID